MINDVYQVAEDGMWKAGFTRTNADYIKSKIKEDVIIVAHF